MNAMHTLWQHCAGGNLTYTTQGFPSRGCSTNTGIPSIQLEKATANGESPTFNWPMVYSNFINHSLWVHMWSRWLITALHCNSFVAMLCLEVNVFFWPVSLNHSVYSSRQMTRIKLPRTSALCTYTEVQISPPRAVASIPTVPSPFPCRIRIRNVFYSFHKWGHLQELLQQAATCSVTSINIRRFKEVKGLHSGSVMNTADVMESIETERFWPPLSCFYVTWVCPLSSDQYLTLCVDHLGSSSSFLVQFVSSAQSVSVSQRNNTWGGAYNTSCGSYQWNN